MNTTPYLTPQQIVDRYRARFGSGLADAKVTERGEGTRKVKAYNLWFRVDRDLLRPAIEELIAIRFPHLAVIAGNDLGSDIELLYIFSVFYGQEFG